MNPASSATQLCDANDVGPPSDASILEMLPSDLRRALEVQSREDHQPILQLLIRLIIVGAAAEGLSPAGRCSTRLSRCFAGPQVLALQQAEPLEHVLF